MSKKRGLKTSEAQLRAIQGYQKRNARLVLWVPKKAKAQLDRLLAAKGYTPKDIFIEGLKLFGVDPKRMGLLG